MQISRSTSNFFTGRSIGWAVVERARACTVRSRPRAIPIWRLHRENPIWRLLRQLPGTPIRRESLVVARSLDFRGDACRANPNGLAQLEGEVCRDRFNRMVPLFSVYILIHVLNSKLFKTINIQIQNCSKPKMFKFEIVQNQKCSKPKMFKFKLVQICKCSNLKSSNLKLSKFKFFQIRNLFGLCSKSVKIWNLFKTCSK
jgi:hypothetical protein